VSETELARLTEGTLAPGAYSGADYALPDETAALIREAVPENTALAYRSRWRSFEAWCRDAGRVALPATAQTVAAYLTHLAVDRGLKATTADAHLTAIRAVHRGAGTAAPDGLAARKVVVAAAKREAARDGRYGPRKALPLTAADLPAIVAACDVETAAGLRDRAVILLGFAVLARRAELAALNVSDIEHVPGEGLAVTIRASKTDQAARGAVRRIHYASAEAVCPVRAVLAWLEYLTARGITRGPLFTRVDRWGNLGAGAGGRYTAPKYTGARAPDEPSEAAILPRGADLASGARRAPRPPVGRDGRLRPQAIGDIVTAACVAAGLTAPRALGGPSALAGQAPSQELSPSGERRRYTGHSLRRGGATSMLKVGAQPLSVSRHGRWADGSRAFAGYVEEATGFGDANPTKGLLLPPSTRRLAVTRNPAGTVARGRQPHSFGMILLFSGGRGRDHGARCGECGEQRPRDDGRRLIGGQPPG
jgi:integrase